MIERRQEYSLVNSGNRIGRVNGLAVLGADSGLSDYSGIMLPVEALVILPWPVVVGLRNRWTI